MSSDVYVAYLEVLGFKSLIENNPGEELINKYKAIIEPAIGSILSNDDSSVGCTVISEAIVLWTKDASMKAFIEIVTATRKLLVHGILGGLPLRGGISLGPLSHASLCAEPESGNRVQTIVGRGLAKAYKIGTALQMSGCIISDSAVNSYIQHAKQLVGNKSVGSINYLIDKGMVVNCSVPVRIAFSNQTVVNWPRGFEEPPTTDLVREAFSKHNKSLSHPTVEHKVHNTLNFLREMLA